MLLSRWPMDWLVSALTQQFTLRTGPLVIHIWQCISNFFRRGTLINSGFGRGTLHSLSRHSNVPRHTVWETLIYGNETTKSSSCKCVITSMWAWCSVVDVRYVTSFSESNYLRVPYFPNFDLLQLVFWLFCFILEFASL